MCGIAGVLNFDGEPASPPVLHRMGEALRHRGPDDRGQVIDGACGLAHRRLAIIDLSDAGHQPMATEDDRFVIAYNGEVFNFRELRTELEGLGRTFRSRTDTEVVLNAFAHWGPEVVSRFNGQFALAVWDRASRRLFLARDRYGIKPLYVWRNAQRVVFGSEIKAILQHPECHAALDNEGLLEYLTFQNFFTERTLFKGISTVPAGSWMSFANDGETCAARYWDFNFVEPDGPRSDELEYREELDRLLRQAVKRQLVADVEVGGYLSGGMDSGTITALAAHELPFMRTFTCGFDLRSASGIELGFDERDKAEQMSSLFRTEHYEVVLKAGDMERVLPRLTWHMEEPRVGQSYPNFYVAQLAARFGKVVLSGEGGDELFAGYPWRYYPGARCDTFDGYIDTQFTLWQRLLPPGRVKDVFAPIWADVSHVSTRDIVRSVFRGRAPGLTRPEDFINQSLYFEAKTFLHGLLVVQDKVGMAHGLETRVPLLDNDLVDFAMALPVGLKLGNLTQSLQQHEAAGPSRNHHHTSDGKLLLRRVMARHVPLEIANGVKQGLSAPDASWFRGESVDYVRRSLMGPQARIFEFLDRDTVHALIDDHLDGRENRRLLIWSLLNLEEWLKHLEAGSWTKI